MTSYKIHGSHQNIENHQNCLCENYITQFISGDAFIKVLIHLNKVAKGTCQSKDSSTIKVNKVK